MRIPAMLLVAASIAIAPVPASEAPPAPTAEEFAERERIRPVVEGALADLREPADPSEPLPAQRARVAETLAGLGPAVVPFLAAELDLPDAFTFPPSAWALGLVGTPEALQSIRKAMAIADREADGFGRHRKVWCVYALGLAGDETALLDAAGGVTPVDWYEFMEGMRLADIVAVLTQPRSLGVLTRQIEGLRAPAGPDASDDESREQRLIHAVRALGWVGGPETVALLVELASHPSVAVRIRAVSALGRLRGKGVAEALVSALSDPSTDVRAEAALGLHRLREPDRLKALLARLEVEEITSVRAWLYRAVAVTASSEAALEVFRSHRNRPDSFDRAALASAVAETGDRAGLNLLRTLLRDRSVDVALAAEHAIHRLGGEGAKDTLLALIGDPRMPVAQTAIELLTEDGERRAAPRIAESLLRMTSRSIPDPSLRSQLQIRAAALVNLRYTEPFADLRKNAPLQADPADRGILEAAAEHLEKIRDLGDDSRLWLAAAAEDPGLRALAYERLAEIGDASALEGLIGTLETASEPDEARILRALAASGAPLAAAAFSRRLEDPTWDAPSRQEARTWAAWGARSLATPGLIDALERSVVRRSGKDFATLAYLAVVAPERALPLIRRTLPSRLRHHEWSVGHEQWDLWEILVEIESGRSAAGWDRPPDRVHRH